jgi:tetratricopeptide (TPR) repeat protein
MKRLLCLLMLLGSLRADAAYAGDCAVQTEQAIEAFLQKQPGANDKLAAAISDGCDDPNLFLFAGVQKRQGNDLAAAISLFEQGVRHHPTHQALGLELAITLAFQGRLKESLARYQVLLVRDPSATPVLLGKARILTWMERATDSLPIYRKILAADPHNLEAKRGMAAALLALLRRKEAAQLYREVLRAEPQDEEARSGLAMVQSVSIGDVTLLAGISGAAQTGISPIAGIRATWKVTPRLQLAMAYQLDAPFLYGDAVQSSGYRQRAETAVTLRLGPRVELGIGYQLAVQNDTLRHGIPIELSLKLPRSLVLLTGARPALDQRLNLSLLALLGIQYHFRPELWLMLQGFRYDDTGGEHATAVVLTLQVPLGQRGIIKGGGVYGRYRAGDTYGGFVEGQLHVHARVDLGIFYQYAAGFFEQHTTTLSVRWRY